jgi:hypothetical protein
MSNHFDRDGTTGAVVSIDGPGVPVMIAGWLAGA